MHQVKNSKFIFLFSFIYFVSCYALSYQWYLNHYFDVFDILFDTDPNTTLASFAHGSGRNALSHAFLEGGAIFTRFIEFIISLFAIDYDRERLREVIALGVSPLFSALTLIYFYKITILLKIKVIDACLLTLIFAFFASNIIFAILPESFSLSCFVISVLIYYFFCCKENDSHGDPKVWIGLAIMLTGITITNIFTFAIVYFLHLLNNRKATLPAILKRVSRYCIIAGLAVLILYFGGHLLLGIKFGGAGGPSWISRFVVLNIDGMALNFFNLFSASINSLVAILPEVSKNHYCTEMACNKLSFIRELSNQGWLYAVMLFCLVLALFSKQQIIQHKWRDLYLISGLIIGFNFSLHTIFGSEMFLYTQHWVVPQCLLLVPILAGKRMVSIVILCMLAILNINFIINVEQLVALQ